MMEMRLPTREELRTAYRRDMIPAFPPSERRPLARIEKAYREGWYRPWCLFDDGELIGEAFVLAVKSGYVLFDYLCIEAPRRNGGIGAALVKLLLEKERGNILFGEVEIPAFAEDPDLAERRRKFYLRLGAKQARYDTAIFGVPYHTLYWPDGAQDEAALCLAHRESYQKAFAPHIYAKNVFIPWDRESGILQKGKWEEEE